MLHRLAPTGPEAQPPLPRAWLGHCSQQEVGWPFQPEIVLPSPFHHLQLSEAPQLPDIRKTSTPRHVCLQNEAWQMVSKNSLRLPVTAAGSNLQRQRTCFAEFGFQLLQCGWEVLQCNFCMAPAEPWWEAAQLGLHPTPCAAMRQAGGDSFGN